MGGAASIVGDVAGGVGGALGGLGGAVGGLVSGIGGGLSEMNPFHKIDTSPVPTLQGPGQVTAGPGGQIDQNVAGPNAAQIANVKGPQSQNMQGVGVGSQNAFRQAQLAQINGLQNLANGQDNTAQRMLQQQTQQNVANQFAMANSARPGQQAAAMRNAMNNAQQMNAAANVQGANLGLQQRMQAAQLVGNIAGQGAGQDISVAGQNAALGTQANIAGFQGANQAAIAQGQLGTQANIAGFQGNTQRALTQGQLAQQQAALGVQAQQYNAQNTLGYDNALQNQWSQVNGLQTDLEAQRRKAIGNTMSGLGGMFGSMSTLFGSSGAAAGGEAMAGGADLGSLASVAAVA